MKANSEIKNFGVEYNFYFKRVSQIFLYGDNFIARKLYGRLHKEGYSIKAIIDKKYKTHIKERNGMELLSLDLLDNVSNDSIVVITLANGLVHENVKNDLSKKGFQNILYLPMFLNRPLQEQDCIRRAYYCVMNNQLSESFEIPKTFYEEKNDETIKIFINEDDTAFLCDLDFLRTPTEKTVRENVLPGRDSLFERAYQCLCFDKLLKDYKAYVELFRYLSGEGIYPKAYLYIQRETEDQRSSLLRDRQELYAVYEQNYECNFSFFLYSPARAEWNEKGYFNIVDGMHRCVYLMFKGKKEVPIVVSNEDFQRFLNYRR